MISIRVVLNILGRYRVRMFSVVDICCRLSDLVVDIRKMSSMN